MAKDDSGEISDELRSRVMREMGARGGANSRARLTQKRQNELSLKANSARWARVHADKKRADKSYVVPEKYREAVAEILKK